MRKNLNKTKHDEHFSSVFVLSFLDLECGFLAVACTANYGAKEPATVDKQLCAVDKQLKSRLTRHRCLSVI